MLDPVYVRAYLLAWALTALSVRLVYVRRAQARKPQSGVAHTVPHPLAVLAMAIWIAFMSGMLIIPDVVIAYVTMVALPAPWVFQMIGLVGWTAGLWLLIRSHQALGAFYGVRLFIKEAHYVVDIGPYAHVRHPMYTAYFLWFVSTVFVFPHPLTLLVVLMGVFGFYRMARGEERMLCAALGEPYASYIERTGMFLPKRIRAITS